MESTLVAWAQALSRHWALSLGYLILVLCGFGLTIAAIRAVQRSLRLEYLRRSKQINHGSRDITMQRLSESLLSLVIGLLSMASSAAMTFAPQPVTLAGVRFRTFMVAFMLVITIATGVDAGMREIRSSRLYGRIAQDEEIDEALVLQGAREMLEEEGLL